MKEGCFCTSCGERIEAGGDVCRRCGVVTGRTLLDTGAVIREYRIVGLLGAGGVGEVYQAVHTLTTQTVAIKVLYPQYAVSGPVRERFVQEAKVLSSLSHENIVGLHTFFEEMGRLFMVMDFVEGRTLDELLGEGPLPKDRLVAVCKGVLAGLQHAHAHDPCVIHRDIKPANILVRLDGSVVVTDFGIARLQGQKGLTQAGGLIGTPEYMSPEQIQGDEIDAASDLYSFGITLYRMLCGRVPFVQEGESYWPVAQAHVHQAPPPPQGPFVTAPVTAVVMKCLAKQPRERFASAGELGETLESTLTGGMGTERPVRAAAGDGSGMSSAGPPTGRFGEGQLGQSAVRKHLGGPKAVWLAAAAALSLVVAAAAYLLVASGDRAGPVDEKLPVVGTGFSGVSAGAGRGKTSAESPPAEEPPAEAPPTDECGDCPEGTECRDGKCACVAQCSARVCGPDGCGGSCGLCESGDVCQDGRCVCLAHCEGKACGPDGCDGSCGECGAGTACEAGACVRHVGPIVLVPAGQYEVTSGRGMAREYLGAFCIDRLEVNHAQYEGCVASGGCEAVPWTSCIFLEEFGGQKSKTQGHARPSWHENGHPAVCVSPTEAERYCRSVGGFLPSTSQWEAVARGIEGRFFPWGSSSVDGARANGCGKECWFSWGSEAAYDDGHAATAPGGSFPAGAAPSGAEDLIGNVWEWTMSAAGKPVAKGGAWNSKISDLRTSQEYASVTANTRWNSIGFRCAYPEQKCK